MLRSKNFIFFISTNSNSIRVKFSLNSKIVFIFTPNLIGCNCSVNGTITGQMSCDQITGQCKCKPTVSGINCSKCKPGYFNFPKNIGHECETCSCDPGGSVDFSCNQINGK